MRKGTVLVLAGVILLGTAGIALWQLREPAGPPNTDAGPQATQENGGGVAKIVVGSVAATRLERTAAEPFDSIARRAEAGDSAAQRLLGERYLDCLPFSRGLPEATAILATTGIERHALWPASGRT